MREEDKAAEGIWEVGKRGGDRVSETRQWGMNMRTSEKGKTRQ